MGSRYAKKVYKPKDVVKIEATKEQVQPEFGIKIFDTEGGKKAVNAKELYSNLGLSMAHWKRWYTKNIEKNPFVRENKDWISLTPMVSKGKSGKDFAVTLDFAKSLAMQANTEAGEKVRQYFIAIEKKFIEGSRMMTIWEYAKINKITLPVGESSKKALLCKEICRESSTMAGLIPHPKYGFIHAFPYDIIKMAFDL